MLTRRDLPARTGGYTWALLLIALIMMLGLAVLLTIERRMEGTQACGPH
ncbi:hypothetical protein M8C13_20145 [Crossiella sp. SN42]|nr:hypothetical protein [Crossiella sp. SN42]MCO1578068.1 hypothetical protein [Crossiella sp. SN42]